MGRDCVICLSPHRVEYEKMRVEKRMRIKDIWLYAKCKHNETFSYSAILRHMRNHVQSLIEEQKKAVRLRKKHIEQEIQRDIAIASNITKNLQICNDQIKRIRERLETEGLSKELGDIALKWLGESRLIIELLLRWSDKIKPELEGKEDIEDRLYYALKDLPFDYIEQVKKRWDEWKQIKHSPY